MSLKKSMSLLLVLVMSLSVFTVPVYAEQGSSFFITSFNDLEDDMETQYIMDEDQFSDLVLPDELTAMGYAISGNNQPATDFVEEPHEITFYNVNWELKDKSQNESGRNSSSLQSTYVFAPVLTGSSILAEGVELPEVTAVVKSTMMTSLMLPLESGTFVVPGKALNLANHLLAENSDITISGDPSYKGALTASSMFDSINLGTMVVGGKDTSFSLPPGILVTSGSGTPPETNSSENYSFVSKGPSDLDVENYAGVIDSQDSFSLQFDFTVPEDIPAVSFLFMFGSEEYPKFLNSNYVDGAAIIVDGVNYAKFDGDVPLKVVTAAKLYANNGLAIEYNGISAPKVINALLDKTRTTHTLKIVIADTSDTSYDSGLFISAMKTSMSETGGIIENNDASLISVAKVNDDTPGGQSGANPQNAITWDINVPSDKSTINIDDISVTPLASFELYSDPQFTLKLTGDESIPLVKGDIVSAYVKVKAADGVTVKYYAVNIRRDIGIIDIDSKDVTVTSYNGEYDGENHSIEVVDKYEGTVVTYSTSEAGEYTTENPGYKNVGNYTVYYKVDRGANYNVLEGSSTVNINLREVTLKGITITDKIFDGTAEATSNVTGAFLDGVLEGDDVVLDSSNMTALFNDEKVNNDKPISISGYVLSGANASQYNLIQPKDITGNILAETSSNINISIDRVVAAGETDYDGEWTNSDITITLSGDAPSGIEKYQYTTDGGLNWVDITESSLLIEETTDKSYAFRAISNGGISSESSNTVAVKIDKIKPVILNILGNPTTPKHTSQIITFEIFEENSGIDISTLTVSKDGTTIEIKHEDGKYSFITDVNGKYDINVSDSAGNAADKEVVEVTKLDFEKPVISSLIPANNAQQVDTGLLTVIFNEWVMKAADGIGGDITIFNSNGMVFERIDIKNNRIKISENQVGIYLTKPLKSGAEYYVTIDKDVIFDIAGNSFIGIDSSNIWKFKANNTNINNSIIGINLSIMGEQYKAIVDPSDETVYSVIAKPNENGLVKVKITPVFLIDAGSVITTEDEGVEINGDTVTITDIAKESASVKIQIKNADGSIDENKSYTLIILRGSLETKVTKSGMSVDAGAENLRGAVDVSSDISNGKQMELELEITDNGNSVNESQKLEIENFLKGQSIAMYLDIELKLKDITNNTETSIENTQNPVKIKIEIPKDMRGGRDYKIIRVHKGAIEILDTVLEGNYLVFETDRFSQYALSYKIDNEKDESDKNSQAVNLEKHKAYIKGYEDETFRPENNITRAEAATIIARLSSTYDELKYYINVYDDVDAQAWYANTVGFGTQNKLILGYEDGSFRPNASITRAELVSIIARFNNIDLKGESKLQFADASGHWAEEYISALYKLGWINGYEDGSFRPDAEITRAEAVKIINASLGRTPIKEKVDTNISKYFVQFNDIMVNHWAYYDILESSITHTVDDFN